MDKRCRLTASLRSGIAGVGALLVVLIAASAIACGGDDGSKTPTVTATASSTEEQQRSVNAQRTATRHSYANARARRHPRHPSPLSNRRRNPRPEPLPPFEATTAYVAMSATTYSAPSADSQPVQQLYQGAQVNLVGIVSGDNWIIGDQDWVPIEQVWERTWYLLEDGSYIYRAFVYFPDGESPFAAGADRYVIVDLNAQLAWAMDGERIVREIAITSGKAGFETPTGHFEVMARIQNERMTSERAGITGQAEQYDVHRVLYTQYFADGGFALHLNYWQPQEVYGGYPTSHGCVGIPLADAQFLWLFGSGGMRVIVREGGGATPEPAPPPPPPTEVPTTIPTVTSAPVLTATPTIAPTTAPSATASPTRTSTATP